MLTVGLVYGVGYNSAKDKYTAEIEKQKTEYAQVIVAAANEYQAKLNAALASSQRASRDFLATQARLKKENQALKESLHEATADTYCVLDTHWLRHYRTALGVSATDSDGIDTARSAHGTTVTTAALLQHAIDYGHWCQGNAEQLKALQSFLRQGGGYEF